MVKVLFVCHGNICRSPMSAYYMRALISLEGLSGIITADSAATSREEIGNPVYPPARRILASHGVSCDGHAARQMTAADYNRYDLLIGMDDANIRNMCRICGGDPEGKIHQLLDYTDRPGEVSDPWYSGDFESTWRDVTEGCTGILAVLKKEGRLYK